MTFIEERTYCTYNRIKSFTVERALIFCCVMPHRHSLSYKKNLVISEKSESFMDLYRETILNDKMFLPRNDIINKQSKTILQLGK